MRKPDENEEQRQERAQKPKVEVEIKGGKKSQRALKTTIFVQSSWNAVPQPQMQNVSNLKHYINVCISEGFTRWVGVD